MKSIFILPLALAVPALCAVAEPVTPFLAKNCYGCHNQNLKSGGLNLKQYTTPESILHDRDEWETVLRRVKAGEMPPKPLPRPDEAEQKVFTTWLERQFEHADATAKPDPGRVSARRLNRNSAEPTISSRSS